MIIPSVPKRHTGLIRLSALGIFFKLPFEKKKKKKKSKTYFIPAAGYCFQNIQLHLHCLNLPLTCSCSDGFWNYGGGGGEGSQAKVNALV